MEARWKKLMESKKLENQIDIFWQLRNNARRLQKMHELHINLLQLQDDDENSSSEVNHWPKIVAEYSYCTAFTHKQQLVHLIYLSHHLIYSDKICKTGRDCYAY